jgi:hypothetical protein
MAKWLKPGPGGLWMNLDRFEVIEEQEDGSFKISYQAGEEQVSVLVEHEYADALRATLIAEAIAPPSPTNPLLGYIAHGVAKIKN